MVKAHWRTNALLAGVSGALAGLLLVGCSESPSDAKPLPEGTAETTASRTPGTEHAGAVAAYRAMWHDVTVASRTSDASSPLLDDHARGGALELLKYGLQKSKKDGLVSKGAPKADPKVVTAGPTRVVLTDCVDDTGWLLYKRNGELKDDVPGGHMKADATVQLADGVWKVTDLYMHEAGSC
ncbi:hypothetical protein [Streptomyces sp. NPDC002573]|uniref:hypothetical protein n=1 Tax=Streptomyces sp. NPDC002573 TaxID=3364651 RepID=UPI0036B6E202